MTIYKHLSVLILIAMAASASPVYAEKKTDEMREARKKARADIKEAREEYKDAKEKLREEFKELKDAILDKISSKAGQFQGKAVVISGAKILVKGENGFTLEKDGKNYTVNFEDNTKFRRRFWGKSDIDEISVGDIVNIIGKWADEAKTTILAKFIRDTSIQIRHGVFIGTVQSISGNTLVLATKNRGNQTVIVETDTQFTNIRGESITLSQIAVGHRLRVRGLWNKLASTITEVTKVKDYSLPPKTAATVTATPTLKPTNTPTPTATSTPTTTPTPTL